jgi:hypothetical protein
LDLFDLFVAVSFEVMRERACQQRAEENDERCAETNASNQQVLLIDCGAHDSVAAL